MANKAAVECVDRLLQSITGSQLPFGGKVVVALGDFRQVAPVIKDAGVTAVLDASIRTSRLWPSFYIMRLTEPIRNSVDAEFSAWVDTIGEGVGLAGTGGLVELPPQFARVKHRLPELVDFLFPPHLLEDFACIARRSFLSPLNVYVDEFNEYMLGLIPGDACKFSPDCYAGRSYYFI